MGESICQSPNPSEEDLPPQQPPHHKESIFNPRKISILAKMKLQHHAKASQEEVHPDTSFQTEKQATLSLDPSDTLKPPTTPSATSVSSDDQAFHSVPSQYTLESQPERLGVRSAGKSPRSNIATTPVDQSLSLGETQSSITVGLSPGSEKKAKAQPRQHGRRQGPFKSDLRPAQVYSNYPRPSPNRSWQRQSKNSIQRQGGAAPLPF